MSTQAASPSTNRRDLIVLNLAMLVLAGPSLFAKLILLPPQTIIFGRSIIAAVTLYIFLRATRQSLSVQNRKDGRMLVFSGVLMAAHWVTIFHAIQVSTVAIGMIAINTNPIITIFLEPWFFKEKFRGRDLALGAVVLAGVVILVPELEWSNSTAQGVFWGVISAFLFALRNVISRQYVRRYNGTLVMFYQIVVVGVVLLPFMGIGVQDWGEFFSWRLLALGVIFTAGAHTFLVSALNSFKAKTVSVVSVSQVPYSILLAFIFLSEVPDWRAYVGGAVILGAVVFEVTQRE